MDSTQTPKLKVAYSAEASSAAKAGQSSNKSKGSIIKVLFFGFWYLIFRHKKDDS